TWPDAFSFSKAARYWAMRADWWAMWSCARPSQARSRMIASSNSFFERAASVSSMRRMKRPPIFFANRALTIAVRALPTCSRPVGDGAKRTLTSIAERIGDGIAAVAAEIAAGDLHPRRRLAALVFADVEQMLHPPDGGGIVAHGHRLFKRAFPLHQAFQDAVQDVVGRQGVLVGLARAQLGGWRLVDDAF